MAESGFSFGMSVVQKVNARRARPGMTSIALVRFSLASRDAHEAAITVPQGGADANRTGVTTAKDDRNMRPAPFNSSAAARPAGPESTMPAGPESTIATFFPVRRGGRLAVTQPCSNAQSIIARSMFLIVTGGSVMPNMHVRKGPGTCDW